MKKSNQALVEMWPVHSVNLQKGVFIILMLVFVTFMSACAQLHKPGSTVLSKNEKWIILPIENHSPHSLAAANVQSMLETHLRARGVNDIESQTGAAGNVLPVQLNTVKGYRYALTGAVSRWQYDAETGRSPEVSLDLQVHDLSDGKLLWEDRLLRKGRGQTSVSVVANKLISSLLSQLYLTSVSHADSSTGREASAGNSPIGKPAIEYVTASNSQGNFQGNFQGNSQGNFQGNFQGQAQIPSLPLGAALRTGTNQSGVIPVISGAMAAKSTAIFYAPNPPVNVLSQFNRLVLEPDNIKPAELSEFNRRGVSTYAYQSIGEVGPHRGYASAIQPDWVVGSNTAWNSRVMDLESEGWRNFLLLRIGDLVAQGYKGLFMDTMDSYQLAADTEEQRARQETALVSLLVEIKQQYPQLALISNRGFEVLDRVAPLLEAVAAESLYASWDNAKQRYGIVNEGDREWLIGKLSYAKEQLGLDVIAIDYLPPEQRAQARTVAAKIVDHGFIPWISTPGFDSIGIGLLEVIPREVLMIYDSVTTGGLELSEVHKLVAIPLEYLGYVPVYLDLQTEQLPAEQLKGRYAGIVSWLNGTEIQMIQGTDFTDWLQKQLESKVPVAFFGQLAKNSVIKLLPLMGSASGVPIDEKTFRVSERSNLIGFESEPLPRMVPLSIYPYSTDSKNDVHLQYIDSKEHKVDMVVTGPWGGYALNPTVVDVRLDVEPYWIVDPYAFLVEALKLPDIPQPDVTTENGKRLWFAHIDGDALPSWAEMPGKQLGAEVIEERILQRFSLPHTISIVEGEMTGIPAYANIRERMFKVARRIFARDEVEIASHSYSHPYQWKQISRSSISGEYNLPIPGYQYSAEREVLGSVRFIDTELSPANKKTEVMLWTGDALPTEEALAFVANNGLVNMNGGYTFTTKSFSATSLVTPMARPVGDQLQVYAPIMNENVYTNDWTGPFDGFRRVIETLDLTDKPKRLKPANIYYHFYSGTKIASIKALEEVYEWSLEQDIFPVVSSYYIKKVPDFRRAGVARYLDGAWKVSSLGNIRSLRLREPNRWPDVASASGIIGSRQLHDGMYIHTAGANSVSFKLTENPPADYHLVSTNAVVSRWEDHNGALEFRLSGEVPVEMELGGTAAKLCQVKTAKHNVKGKTTRAGTVKFTFSTLDTGNAILNCRT